MHEGKFFWGLGRGGGHACGFLSNFSKVTENANNDKTIDFFFHIFSDVATDQGGKRKRPPVSCKLYDARSKRIKKMGWKPEIVLNICNELAKSLKPPPFSYLLSDQEASSLINTVIGNVPLGFYLGYQLFDKKKSQTVFNVDRPVKKWLQIKVQELSPFPTYHWLI